MDAKGNLSSKGKNMKSISIRLGEQDVEILKRKAQELRLPPTVYARMLIVQGMKETEIQI